MIPLIDKAFILIQKTMLVLPICYYSFIDFPDRVPNKIAHAIKECKILPLVLIKIREASIKYIRR